MQAGFVDRPQVAVADADRLITDLIRERGYPVDDFDTRSELVSVDHPDVVENYRTAHGIAVRTDRGPHLHRGSSAGGDLLPRAVRGDAGRRPRQPQLTGRRASSGRLRPARAGRRGSGRGRASAGACPTRSSAGCPARTSTTSIGGTPTASRHRGRRTDVVHRRARRRSCVSATTTIDFAASRAVAAERDDVAGAHAVDVRRGPLDVLGEHVAPADDDHVLDAPAHHELAVDAGRRGRRCAASRRGTWRRWPRALR